MHECICAHVYMHKNSYIEDILKLNGSATDVMLTLQLFPVDHRIMFSMTCKCRALVNCTILGQSLGITRHRVKEDREGGPQRHQEEKYSRDQSHT